MKYNTVIFDLYGTIVDSYSMIEFNALLADMAVLLEVPKMEFIRSWVKAARESMLGKVSDTVESVKWICKNMNISPQDDKIKRAAQIRFDFERKILMNPRADAMDVLKILRKKKYKIGLISDCTIEAPLLWDKTPIAKWIDYAVFSSQVKIKKPDPRVYNMVLDKFQIQAASAMYVGDGSSRELTGALQVGMYPVKIQAAQTEETALYAVVQERWDGDVIASFYELLPLLD